MTRPHRGWILVAFVAPVLLSGCTDAGSGAPDFGSPEDMRVTSSAFADGGTIPRKYTCQGDDVAPPLRFEEVPGGAAALALVMDDPDAPRGTWVHWTFWNLPIGHVQIPEGRNVTALGAVEGKTSFGTTGYGGPCPPSGVHRYFFKAYALDARLNLTEGADMKALEKELGKHTISWGQLVGRYSKG